MFGVLFLNISVSVAKELASEWMHEYNHIRPHSSLGDYNADSV
ncbi:MAG: transposase [Bacteroidia bacterium]|nr:transposase [Bacteroidia bacterium]